MATIRPNELASYLKKRVNDSQKKTFESWQDKAMQLLKDEVSSYLDEGKSPVGGEGKFEGYSESYKKQIRGSLGKKYGKTERPVNLKLSGKMRKQMKARKVAGGIAFWIASKIAKYHNGDGRVDRKIYPTKDGEKFARPIREKLAKLYIKLFRIK